MQRMTNIGEYVGTKSFIGACTAIIGFITNQMTEIIIVLGMLIILDYIVGMIAALKTTGFDGKKALWGIVKKLLYGVLILLGFLIDYVIYYATEKIGVILPIGGMFGYAITIYLIGTEGFSCIQNLILIGVTVPAFMEKAFGLIRDNAGNLVKLATTKDKKEEE